MSSEAAARRQEGLWEASRQRRTFLLALTMLFFPLGAIILVAAFIPSASQSAEVRGSFAIVGLLLVVGSAVAFRTLIRQGRRVGAVYGIKAAQRAGLVAGPKPPGSSPPP